MLNGLFIAQSGLTSSRVSIENISNNIANENTPGYKKRVVDVTETAHISGNYGVGRGTTVGDVVRATSDYLYGNLVDEATKEGYYQELSTMLSQVEAVFEDTDTSGLANDLDKYFQALEDLNSNANDAVYVNNYISAAKTLVQDLKTLYAGIETQEQVAMESAELDVQKVNSILNEIADINHQLGTKANATNDLLDRRDLLEKQLAQYVNIEVNKNQEPYELNINGTRAVWHDNAREFSIGESSVAQKNKYVETDGTTSSLAAGIGTMDADDTIVFTMNNVGTIELKFGEYVTDSKGNALDINGDSIVDASDMVDDTNYVRALGVAINNDPYMNKLVTAYNGDYTKDANGEIIPADLSVERYLILEAKTPGVDGEFESTLEFKRADATGITENIAFERNAHQSKDGSNEVYLQSRDEKVEISGGSLQARFENLSSESGNNKFQSYKDLLDKFAFTFSDVHSEYAISNNDGSYYYGQDSLDNVGTNIQNVHSLGLFSGSSVMTLEFNELAVQNLNQMDMDYLTTLQWKVDLSFDNGAQNPDSINAMSFSDFFQELLVNVSADKENNDFLLEAQQSVTQSLGSTYDEIVKVDKDEEMLQLVKFQAAYEANAKTITIMDEVLQTLLGIKR